MRPMQWIFSGLLTIHLAAQAQSASYSGLGAESLPPEAVKKFAPPELDKTLARKIQSLMDIRTPGSGILTPDGKKMFFSWRVTGVSQVWRTDGPKGFPVQMTGGEDQTGLEDITPDGKRLIVSRDRGGEENPGLYWQSVEGGALNLISHKKKVQSIFGLVSPDSKSLFFLANDIKDSSYAIYRHDFASGKNELLFSQDGFWRISDHRNGQEFLLTKYRGNRITELYTWKIGDTQPQNVVGKNENEYYEGRFGAKPGEFVILTSKFGEFQRLYSLNKGDWKAISPEMKWDVDDFGIDQERKRIYFSMNENGYGRLTVLNAKNFSAIAFPKYPKAYDVGVRSLSRNGRWAIFSVDAPAAPRQNYVFDWASKVAAQWTVASTPEFDVSTFPMTETEYYTATDGTKIPLLVRRPEKCKKDACPVIVSFHGGPESQSRPGFTAIGQLYAEAGYVVVEPNVRGSTGYGKSWLGADDGPKRLQVISDIRDCAEWIRKNWKVTKIGVVGGSYGGYSSLMAMTMFAGSYDAGVSVVGISNLNTFLKNTAPYRRALRVAEYGDPEKDTDALKELSPTTHVDKIRSPLMIIQGLNDPRVPAGEAVQMYDVMQKKKIASQLVIFPDEGHGSAKRENRVKEIGYAFNFFEKHLKGDANQPQAKPDNRLGQQTE